MSNKIVPSIYRAVIDDVIHAIKPEFDEFGVPEDVLAELQHKWENKVIASRVAEFEAQVHQPAAPAAAHPVATAHHAYPPHPMHLHPHYNPYAALPAQAPSSQSIVKAEPIDTRYMLNTVPYSLPPLPGPPMNGNRQLPPPLHPGGQTGVFSFKAAAPQPAARPYLPPSQPAPTQPAQRIPQVDGPSDEDSPSPPPTGAFASRASHPSLPQPAPPHRPSTIDSDEAINSDLDDSDTECEGETDEVASHDTDIVFCTYDKVARVKNKWKCTLKDGMIHINGKDYLFAKCTGEFEW